MKKQISVGMILSFVSQAITFLVALLYTPIMIDMLGQGEYGLYQAVESIVNYLNLMNFGFNGAYIRYYSIAKAKNDEREMANINGMFMKVFLFISGLCIIAGTILYINIGILGNNITPDDYVTAKKLLVLMVLRLALSFPNSLFVGYIFANEKFIYHHSLNIIINVIVPILSLLVLYTGFGSVGIITISLIANIIRVIYNYWYCKKKIGISINLKFFDKAIFSELLGYTFFIFLSDLVDQLNTNVDKFLLLRILGKEPVAIYSIGFSLKTYTAVFSWIIPEMYVPEANRIAIAEHDDKKLTELFTKIGRYNNFIILLILSGFVILGREFISLWVGDDYSLSYYVGVILLITGYIPAVQTLGVNIQNAKNMHRMRSIVYFVVACINVVASIFFIKKYGVIGTCIGTLFAILVGHGLFMNWYYHKHIKLNIFFFWKEVMKWTIAAAIIFALGLWVHKYVVINTWISLIIFAFIYSIVYITCVYFLGLKPYERNMLKGKIKSIICRGKNEN